MSVDENTALICRLEAALNSGRADAGLELFAEEFLYNGQRMDRQGLLQVRAPLWAAVPDVRWTITEMVAAGDMVATLSTVQGTHQVDFNYPGLGHAPASGKPIHYRYMVMHRIADGQIVEAWDVSDRLTLLQQLGALPAPGSAGG
jgi:steroid delta-isomerase-like uncharacterized protein